MVELLGVTWLNYSALHGCSVMAALLTVLLFVQELEVIVSLQSALHRKVNEAFDQIW